MYKPIPNPFIEKHPKHVSPKFRIPTKFLFTKNTSSQNISFICQNAAKTPKTRPNSKNHAQPIKTPFLPLFQLPLLYKTYILYNCANIFLKLPFSPAPIKYEKTKPSSASFFLFQAIFLFRCLSASKMPLLLVPL